MAKTIEELEKNVSASFGYVKKDMLMLNDTFSDLHDKIQHLSLNQAALLQQFQRIENAVVKDEKKLKQAVRKTTKKKSKKKIKKKAKKKNEKVKRVKSKVKKKTKSSPKKVTKTQEIVY